MHVIILLEQPKKYDIIYIYRPMPMLNIRIYEPFRSRCRCRSMSEKPYRVSHEMNDAGEKCLYIYYM